MLNVYKFVKHEIPELETLKDSTEYKTHQKAMSGEKLTRDEKNWLFRHLAHNSYSKTGIPLGGWMFDFRSVLKNFWVMDRYGSIFSYWAMDKTSIREELTDTFRIVEVPPRKTRI